MIEEFDWPDEPGAEFDNGFMVDDADLPPDYRSGYIAVVGRPNVGKSTLINAYLGEKIAIVSPKAQTTRNRLLGILTTDQSQLIFVDTPGIHKPHHKFGQYMVDTALRAIPDADIIVWLVDGAEPPHPEDALVAEAILRIKDRPPVILAMNKVDLLAPEQVQSRLAEFLTYLEPDLALPISALEGHNRDVLLEAIVERLPFGPRYFPKDQLTDQHLRFIAAEMIREAALKVLRQEVPHALVVQVKEFKERSTAMTYINASIFVERKSQKPIVIGQGGKTIKKIGQLARPEIEAMLGTKVFLDLQVKVLPNWRKKAEELKRFGYSLD
jgi:GTP-binding protein Era